MSEPFDDQVRWAVHHAQHEARRLGQPFIGTEHLLLGLLALPSGTAVQLLLSSAVDVRALNRRIHEIVGDGLDADSLARVGIDLDHVRRTTELSFGPGALDNAINPTEHTGHLPLTRRTRSVIKQAAKARQRMGTSTVRPAHLLLAIVNDGGGIAFTTMRETGLDVHRFRTAVTAELGTNAA